MKIKKVELEDRKVEVRRFLATQIEEFFAKEKDAFLIIADAVVGGFKGTKQFLVMCTDLSEDEIAKLDMEEYSVLVEAMKELNTNFFEQYRRGLAELGKLMSAEEITKAAKKAQEMATEGPPGSSATQELSSGS